MPDFQSLFADLFKVDSIWSVVLRAGIWMGIGLVIIISTDAANAQSSGSSLKKNLGLFLLFILLSGGLMYLLFSFIAKPVAPV